MSDIADEGRLLYARRLGMETSCSGGLDNVLEFLLGHFAVLRAFDQSHEEKGIVHYVVGGDQRAKYGIAYEVRNGLVRCHNVYPEQVIDIRSFEGMPTIRVTDWPYGGSDFSANAPNVPHAKQLFLHMQNMLDAAKLIEEGWAKYRKIID